MKFLPYFPYVIGYKAMAVCLQLENNDSIRRNNFTINRNLFINKAIDIMEA